MASVLYYADTPVQVINATNLALQRSGGDLIIYAQFDKAEEMADRLRVSGPFGKVVTMAPLENLPAWGRCLEEYLIWMRGRVVDLPLDFGIYSEFVLSCPSRITNAILRNMEKETLVTYYEDGTGSYVGSVFRVISYPGEVPAGVPRRRAVVELQRSLLQVLARPWPITPSSMYVYRPDLLTYAAPCAVKKLTFSEKTTEIFKDDELKDTHVFPQQNTPDTMILFDILRNDKQNRLSVRDLLRYQEIATRMGFTLWVKPHPRTKEQASLYEGLNLFPDVSWELFVSQFQVENWLLVGECSSALLTPALQFNQFPRVLFADSLVWSKTDNGSAVRDSVIDCCRRAYGPEAHRVEVAHNRAEFEELLHLQCRRVF